MSRNAMRWPVAALVCFTLVVLFGSSAAAQVAPRRDFLSQPRVGIGYSGALPNAILGARVWYLTGPRRFGAFADFKMTQPRLENDDNYCPSRLQQCTVEWVRQNEPFHYETRTDDEWLTVNAGGMYAFSPEFALLIGGGAARRNQVREYLDDTDEAQDRITLEGNYFVPVGEQEWVAQAVVGLLLRAGNRLAFSFGHETGPKGMTVGLYLVLP